MTPSTTTEATPYVMRHDEIVRGCVLGTVGTLPPANGTISPRAALEAAVRPALARAPCGVKFSGGRDSSLVLAVATHVARRDGLPDPIPLTLTYPRVEAADEADWQETTIRHLGLEHWQRIAIDDEADLVGPLAQRHLRQHGVIWPTTISVDTPLLDLARGGSLLDGEGGDEVLGDETHRIGPLARQIRHVRPLRRERIVAAIAALGPVSVRSQRLRRFWDLDSIDWLRPAGRELLTEALRRVEADRPILWSHSVRCVPIQRHHVLMRLNRNLLARAWDIELHSPLLDPRFVHAIARQGGPLGPGTRTAQMRALASDLLPSGVLVRRTKAEFTACYLGRHTADFAKRWSGDGLDPHYVDAEALRLRWRGDRPHALTAPLLQQAWLHDDTG